MFSALGESFFDGQHLVMNWRLYVSEPIFEGTAQVSCFILQLLGCAMSSKGTVDVFTSLKNETLTYTGENLTVNPGIFLGKCK